MQQNIKENALSIKNDFIFISFIGLMSRVFANRPGDQGSILGRGYQRLKKMVLDAALLNT